VDKFKHMSDENGQEIGVNVYDNDEDELIEDEEAAATQPLEVVGEEIVTVTKNSDTEENDSEDDLYEVVKVHSDQISRLTEIVESLQSQIKAIDQRRASGNNNKTSSIRRRNRSTTKTKKNKATSKKPKGKRSTKRK
jgi:hypothetical protein